MNWFYSKDGQQVGPVAFTEIERLHGSGELNADSLVWQQGSPNWVKLSTVLASPAAPPLPTGAPALPTEPAAASPISAAAPTSPMTPAAAAIPAAPLPDYGDFLCWGFIGVLVPCVGALIYIALLVLNFMEYFAARKAVEEGRLAASDYSRINPALFILGFICCGGLLYPLFMNFRNKSGYFKPQPQAVLIGIIVVVLMILEYSGMGMMNSSHSYQFGN